ncbi:MAG: hypothetical protein C5B48_16490 [Candidatus Rokuibacteriota bacterium]|nr:MAG: hypothetical protein C5B48_16490 [Candidatus Rokubacteria bacterium]
MTLRSAGSLVVALAALVQGCGGLLGKAAVPVTTATDAGTFQVLKGRRGVVIGAPHGTSDRETDLIGRDLARITGWSLVVGTGVSNLVADGQRSRIDEAYRRHVDEAAQGPLSLYVEVHGSADPESAGRVKIATVGLSREDAWRLKVLYELVRDARLQAEAPRLDVWIESLDPVRDTAPASRRIGLLAASPRALSIELPRLARTSYREMYTALLGDVLVQCAPFLISRAP